MSRQDRVEWFKSLSKTQGQSFNPVSEFLAELKVEDTHREEMKAATIAYVTASLENSDGINSEDALMAELDANIGALANRTPNGHLRPKSELEQEFNRLHAAVSTCIQSWGIDDIISTMFVPLTIRVVNGAPNAKDEARPYSSTKVHVDLWGGEPADTIDLFIPILGDIEHTTIEFFAPPDDFDDRLVRSLSSYDEGVELMGEVALVPLPLKHGFAYFADAIVPHRTIKKGGLTRITIQLTLRRKSNEAEQAIFSQVWNPGKLEYYIPPKQWLALGNTTLMQFNATYADAKRGIFPESQYDEPIYVKAS